MSGYALYAPARWRRDTSQPASRTIHERRSPADIPHPSRSTHRELATAPTPVRYSAFQPLAHRQTPSLAAAPESIPDSARPSLARTALWRTPALRQSRRLLPVTTASDRPSTWQAAQQAAG